MTCARAGILSRTLGILIRPPPEFFRSGAGHRHPDAALPRGISQSSGSAPRDPSELRSLGMTGADGGSPAGEPDKVTRRVYEKGGETDGRASARRPARRGRSAFADE